MAQEPLRERPSRRTLKSTLLWCARWLVADEFYTGPVHIEIAAQEEGERILVEPVPIAGQDGMILPDTLGVVPGSCVGNSELLRVLLSEDERKILSVLADSAPVKAATVQERSKVEKSRFWVLWSNLQFRGFIADAERGEGYTLAIGWIREVLGQEEERPAA